MDLRMKWVMPGRGHSLSHPGSQNLVPVQVQTAVVMSEDSDPWGIDHNKKRKRQVWLSYLLSMDLIPAIKKEKGMCHPRMEMPSLHEVIASTQQLE